MSFAARARVLLSVCISLLLVASAKAWSLSALPHACAGSARGGAASARAAIMDFSSQHGPAQSAQGCAAGANSEKSHSRRPYVLNVLGR
jgi:hypothetical protein